MKTTATSCCIEWYNNSNGKPVHSDIDKEVTPNKSEKITVRQWPGTVIVYAGLTEHFNHRTGRVAYHFFENNIGYLQDQPEKPPLKPRLMTMEMDSDEDYDPNDDK